MKRSLLHIWIVVTIICAVSVALESVRAQAIPATIPKQGENIEANDKLYGEWSGNKERPIENTVLASNHAQRIGVSRTPRPSSNNGGNSGRNFYLQKANNKYNLLKFAAQLPGHDFSWTHWEAVSPRLYYVIALRRILC